MPPTLLLVPPDTRPPTLDFPKGLAEAAGLRVFIPPAEALPKNINEPGKFDVLEAWLKMFSREAELLILCLETLCLGGMIPARRLSLSLAETLYKLKLLSELKMARPALRILAFGVIVRVAHGNDPYEEKPYFGDYGDALRAYSEAFDRFERHRRVEDAAQLEQAQKQVPADHLQDWLETRQRNHRMHLRALELVAEGVIEHLCLTLDDTSTYGLAAHDRRALEAKTDELSLWSQVDIYPGADEVPCTLLARALQKKPSRVFLHYSSALGAQADLIFEDRCAGELIKAQLRAAKCYGVETSKDADFVLAVNTPGKAQLEQSEQPDFGLVDTADRHLPEFVDFIERMLTQKPIALADIAYPNGAELRLMNMLRKRVPLASLAAYGGWNTAGNTLGGVIAMAVIALQVKDKSKFMELLFKRYVDDYLYQAIVRRKLAKELAQLNPWHLGSQMDEAEKRLAEYIRPLALELWAEHFAPTGYLLHWQEPKLAWPRLFTGVFPLQVKD